MKVFSLLEMNDFSNHELSLDDLDRIQKARSREFYLYLELLANKYSWELSHAELSPWMAWMLSPLSPSSSLAMKLKSLSRAEKDKYKIMYNRMMTAMKAFEKAGGQWEGGQKQWKSGLIQ